MSFEDPDRRSNGRRRHASARRGRGALWLAVAGGVAVLGLGAAALSGGSGGTRGPAEREREGAGLPTLIQPGAPSPSDGSEPPATAGPGRTADATPSASETSSASPTPPAPETPSAPATALPSATTGPAPTATEGGGEGTSRGRSDDAPGVRKKPR
ncbi:hypothetical protein [Streptomyces sp. CC208A]|uniref:hypothetical protein n=1 Tax=Streptomyces sp. CC208A TaxID=3044573 RepID=UPI0024A7AD03|nr:hypothetical protein [Streptomyces sp. CC208A]